MIRKTIICSAGIALLSLANVSQAASIRCGSHLIHDTQRNGATKYEVLKKCGEPKARMGNTWIYRKSGRDLALDFNNSGRLLTIRSK